MKKSLLVLSLIALSACSSELKQKIGLLSAGPDEYIVRKSKAFEVPKQFDLPEPGTIEEVSEEVSVKSDLVGQGGVQKPAKTKRDQELLSEIDEALASGKK